MAKDFAKDFYQSKQWQTVRDYMMSKYHYMCQKCNEKPAEIVHHIIWLNASNIHDIEVTLNEKNLLPVCRECHALIHEGVQATIDELKFDEFGNLVRR